jgi:cysteine desulfurase
MIECILLIFAIIVATRGNNIYDEYVYLDNNATTRPNRGAIEEFNKNMFLGNASVGYASKARKIIERTRSYILWCAGLDPDEYIVVLTSGASESINMFINTMMKYNPNYNIQTSSYEHATTMDCLKQYSAKYINPDVYGIINPHDFKYEPNLIVTLIMTHNEIGSTNNINKEDLPEGCIYHADVVQSFGKHPLVRADAYSISFHKLYGFPGSGALIIHKNLLPIFKTCPRICGHQNYKLRGGTENVAQIASIYGALKETFKNRVQKNIQLISKKEYIVRLLAQHYPFVDYAKYVINPVKYHRTLFEFTVINQHSINTIFLASVSIFPVCNKVLQTRLLTKKIIVGLGAACSEKNTVLDSVFAPPIIKQSIIRVSLGDYNTYADCRRFVNAYIAVLQEIWRDMLA